MHADQRFLQLRDLVDVRFLLRGFELTFVGGDGRFGRARGCAFRATSRAPPLIATETGVTGDRAYAAGNTDAAVADVHSRGTWAHPGTKSATGGADSHAGGYLEAHSHDLGVTADAVTVIVQFVFVVADDFNRAGVIGPIAAAARAVIVGRVWTEATTVVRVAFFGG